MYEQARLNMRHFIRHPSDIPIDFDLGEIVADNHDCLKNISDGGLCFIANQWIDPGTVIHVAISITPPEFHASGITVWCKALDDCYEVGVRFEDAGDGFALRMVEQVCHIEQYKQDVLKKEGRRLTGEQAAIEWIERYAAAFPR